MHHHFLDCAILMQFLTFIAAAILIVSQNRSFKAARLVGTFLIFYNAYNLGTACTISNTQITRIKKPHKAALQES